MILTPKKDYKEKIQKQQLQFSMKISQGLLDSFQQMSVFKEDKAK
jgi:hypothetical protein